MKTRVSTMLLALSLCIGLAGRPLAAAPITDSSYFNSISHTLITFDVDGSGVNLPVTSSLTLASTEYAAQGVSFLPNTRLTQDSDSCFRFVQNFAGGSTPYGVVASQTSSMVFNPPVKAFGFVFIAISFQYATFTARDSNGAVIETAVFADCTPRVHCFVHGTGCGFLEYGFVGISSSCTPIARVDISAFSGVIDNLNFAAADSGGTLPTIACPGNATVECGGSTDTSNIGTATSTGGCGTVTLSHSDATTSGSCVNQVVKTITRTWTATDSNGNMATCGQTITVKDTAPPVITANGTTLTLGCNPSALVIDAALGTATASDNCGVGTPTASDSAVLGNCTKSQTRTWNVSDNCGNAAAAVSRTVTWTEDTTPPIITATGTPAGGALGCNPTPAAIEAALGTATASDNCAVGTPTASDSAVTGACTKSQTRTWKVTDACGNSATALSRTVTWTDDSEAPVITATGNTLALGCNPDAAAIEAALGSATATDNCGVAAPTYSDSAVTGGCAKSQTRTWNVSDNCGNAATAVSRTVTWTDDTTKPTITTCPTGGDLGSNPPTLPTCDGVKAQVVASDNCTGTPTINCPNSEDSTTNCVVTRKFTITATDGCGNASDPCYVTYTWIADTAAPIVACASVPIELGCNPDTLPTADNAAGQVVATDASCGLPTIHCGPASDSGTCVVTRTFTCAATDTSNNVSAPCNVTYTWRVDTTPPVITVSGTTLTLGCHPEAAAIEAALGTATATDNCGAVTPTRSDSAVTGDCTKSQTRTWNVTDACGNMATPVSRTVTWTSGTTPPVITATGTTLTLGCNPTAAAIEAALGTAAATGTCGPATSTSTTGSVVVGGCSRCQTRTWNATDACGNAATPVSRTLSWTVDTTPPVITCPTEHSCGGSGHGDDDGHRDGDDDDGDDDDHDGDDHDDGHEHDHGIVRHTEPGKCSAVVWYPAPTVSDHCSSVTVVCSPPSGTSFPTGATIVTCTANDVCGNLAACTFAVIVKDKERPVMDCPVDIDRSTDPGRCTAVVNFATPAATDNCPGVSVVCNPPSGTAFAKGRTTVKCTATDASGNKTTREFTVTVRDTERPVITCPGNITLPCNANRLSPAAYSVTATDNCPGVVLRYSKECGSGFPVGTTTVTATATDSSCNTSTCSFNVTRAPIGFVGFQSPIVGADATGGSYANTLATFRLGSTIPVKFTASCGGSPLLTGVHTLQAVKYSSAVSSNPPIDATPTDAATTGNQFRQADGQWHFNLSTQTGYSAGTWKLIATLSDGSTHYAWITIKR